MEDMVVGNYIVKTDRYYTKDHEWVLIKDGKAYIGITDYAQKMLGDIVYVDLPEEGTELDAGETLANVESVKNVSPVYCPVSGTVVEVNSELSDEPGLINHEPYDAGWIAAVEMRDTGEVGELLTAEDYAELLKEIIKEEEGGEQEEEVSIEGIEESIEEIPEDELRYEEER